MRVNSFVPSLVIVSALSKAFCHRLSALEMARLAAGLEDWLDLGNKVGLRRRD